MSALRNVAVEPFGQLYVLLTRHWALTCELSRREITERYAGQFLGTFWVLFHPIFLIGLYMFIFTCVLKTGAQGVSSAGGEYPVYLLSGLICWMSFQESINKGCLAITANSALVKQVVFPIEVLPLKAITTAILNQIIALSLLFVYLLTIRYPVTFMILTVPMLFVFQGFGMLGISYALSALTVFVKDIRDFVQLFSMAGLYLVPVFYFPQWVPETIRPVLALNPFSHMIWCYQDAIAFGSINHGLSWIFFPSFCIFLYIFGYRTFRVLRPMFGNVL